MIDETFYIYSHFTGEEELLLVELTGHFLLERLMKELPQDDDEGENNEENENKPCGGEVFLLFYDTEDALKHRVIYSQNRQKVKKLKGKKGSCKIGGKSVLSGAVQDSHNRCFFSFAVLRRVYKQK
jgi:hypothetical protein